LTDDLKVADASDAVYARQPPVKFYRLTEDKLQSIKKAPSNVSQDLGFMTFFSGIFIAGLIAIITNPSLPSLNFPIIVLVALTIAAAFLTLITFIRWYPERNDLSKMVDEIIQSDKTE
jgi:glucan phosphoethanolaminetransferase (alkaline phosphatase superfamily)